MRYVSRYGRDNTLIFGIRSATATPGCRKNFFLNGALMSDACGAVAGWTRKLR